MRERQKFLAKLFYWIGVCLFLTVTIFAVAVDKISPSLLTGDFRTALSILFFVAVLLLCLGVVNFSIYFLQQRTISPAEARIPRKYYLLVVVFLTLLGLAAI